MYRRSHDGSSFIGNKVKFIVLEFIEKGDLYDHLMRTDKGFSEGLTRYIFWQMMRALDYAHFNRVVHRDIKLENIMLDKDYKLKLIDFGFVSSTYGLEDSGIF